MKHRIDGTVYRLHMARAFVKKPGQLFMNSIQTDWLAFGCFDFIEVTRFSPLKRHSQYCHKMRCRGKHDEDMPDLMEPKHTRHKVEDLRDVNNCAKCVNHSARCLS